MRNEKLIDTHVHLNNRELLADLPGVLERADAAGVGTHIVVGYDMPSSQKAVELAAQDSRIFAVVGVHPHEAKRWDANASARLREWAANPRVVAIGEIGLDFYRDLSPRDLQQQAFLAQIALAREVNLPIVIHCRDAYEETLAILEAEAVGMTVDMHCFLGDATHAERLFRQGWYIGIDGPITYKKNDWLRDIVRDAPRDRIVLETDAPYLSPEPLRSKHPNEPARVALVAQRVAEVRGDLVSEVTGYTADNARRLFPRLVSD